MKNYILLLTIVNLFSFNSYAQQSKINDANKNYNNYAYIDAIKTYERIAEKGYKSDDLFKKLGNSYYFNSEYESAAKWYRELFSISTNAEPEYYYRYAQCLKSIGQMDQADKLLEEFSAKYKTDSRGLLYQENTSYLDKIKANSGRYKIENEVFNSKYSDYSTFAWKNNIYFASARDTGSFSKRKHKWTGEYFTNLYIFDSLKAKKIKAALNSKFHESSPTLTKDGKTIYFTRNNYIKGRKGKDENKITGTKIYRATLINEKWTNIMELPFNSNKYSTAHPALSPDEKTIYFASDMPGTIGQSDIYKVRINNDGGYGTPENLGKPVNTEARETFPYITGDNEIYFASDGHPGLGGLDVFTGTINDNGSISTIQNVGSDINSPNDDFGYSIDAVSRKGYFSSNKEGGKGADDIYKFLETRRLQCIQELAGIVTDAETGSPLPEAKITLYENQTVKNTALSDLSGLYAFAVECGRTYNIRAEKTDYITKEVSISISTKEGKTTLPIALDKARCKVTVGDDLGKCFGIKMIYFALDQALIGQEAIIDLEKILDVLNQYPAMKLDIRSHTDSRQTQQYNQILSDKRALSTINWLVKNGISKKRLTGKGFGESQLVNGCKDGVQCLEAEHKMNRRSEFIITQI